MFEEVRQWKQEVAIIGTISKKKSILNGQKIDQVKETFSWE